MRFFWSLVAVLLVGGAVLAFLPRGAGGGGSGAGVRESGKGVEAREVKETPAGESGMQLAADADAPAVVPAAVSPPGVVPAAIVPVETEPVIDAAAVNDIIAKAAAGTTDVLAPVIDVKGGTEVTLPSHANFPSEKVIPAKAVRVGKDLVLDGKYRVTGAGTKADPYVVPFDLLLSARDDYNPRKGLTKMPQRIAFLHEKHVSLTGYTAFIVTSTDPRELLVMFNAWDGCCIGVPPTEYDAVETRLSKPADAEQKMTTFATVTGVLKVDPYIDNGWLLGLYLMEEAEMTNAKSEPAAPNAQPEDPGT